MLIGSQCSESPGLTGAHLSGSPGNYSMKKTLNNCPILSLESIRIIYTIALSRYHNVALSRGKNAAHPLENKTPLSLTWVNIISAVTADVAV